jgi:hypothetical protein
MVVHHAFEALSEPLDLIPLPQPATHHTLHLADLTRVHDFSLSLSLYIRSVLRSDDDRPTRGFGSESDDVYWGMRFAKGSAASIVV